MNVSRRTGLLPVRPSSPTVNCCLIRMSPALRLRRKSHSLLRDSKRSDSGSAPLRVAAKQGQNLTAMVSDGSRAVMRLLSSYLGSAGAPAEHWTAARGVGKIPRTRRSRTLAFVSGAAVKIEHRTIRAARGRRLPNHTEVRPCDRDLAFSFRWRCSLLWPVSYWPPTALKGVALPASAPRSSFWNSRIVAADSRRDAGGAERPRPCIRFPRSFASVVHCWSHLSSDRSLSFALR